MQVAAAEIANLSDLDGAIAGCRACPRLVEWREQIAAARRAAYSDQEYWGRPVPGFGPATARILVVGLAPAAHGGNRTGRVFTGDRSGDWLYAALHRAGLANQAESVAVNDGLRLTDVRVAAAVRCAPPGNAPSPEEFDTCAPWLRREFELLGDVRAILALGQLAWRSTLNLLAGEGFDVPRPRPQFGHGRSATVAGASRSAITVIGSYHPSQQNTFTGRLTTNMLDEAVAMAVRACR